MNKFDYDKILNKIARQCSTKEYCTLEILCKLQKTDLDCADINKIVNFLRQHGFIDDLRYAKAYVKDKARFNKWGRLKIQQMLQTKYLDSNIVSEAMREVSDEEFEDTCLDILRSKLQTLKDEEQHKKKVKLIRFALGKGFTYDTVLTAIEKLNIYA